MSDTTISSTGPAGRSIADFSEQAGIGKSTYYTIPEEFRPVAVKIGKRVVITESPADWLQRMNERGGVPLRRTSGRVPA